MFSFCSVILGSSSEDDESHKDAGKMDFTNEDLDGNTDDDDENGDDYVDDDESPLSSDEEELGKFKDRLKNKTDEV